MTQAQAIIYDHNHHHHFTPLSRVFKHWPEGDVVKQFLFLMSTQNLVTKCCTAHTTTSSATYVNTCQVMYLRSALPNKTKKWLKTCVAKMKTMLYIHTLFSHNKYHSAPFSTNFIHSWISRPVYIFSLYLVEGSYVNTLYLKQPVKEEINTSQRNTVYSRQQSKDAHCIQKRSKC